MAGFGVGQWVVQPLLGYIWVAQHLKKTKQILTQTLILTIYKLAMTINATMNNRLESIIRTSMCRLNQL